MTSRAVTRGRLALTTGAAALMLLTGCGGSTGGSTGSGGKNFDVLINTEDSAVQPILKSLSTGACSAQNKTMPLKIETVPQTQLDQKLQLLAGQKALPLQFSAGNAPALTQELDKAGDMVDFTQTMTGLGVLDDVSPAAISTIKALYGGKFNALPYQYNIEGIWYNKKLFAASGISEPKTWDELVAAADQLDSAGVQPFSASGEQGWPLTRYIGAYLFREMGSDALKKVADGQAKLTDPQYVAAATKVAALGTKGYFGKGLTSIDYDTSVSQFLSGKAAMIYNGSWMLSDINDATKDTIGAANVGFMPFPAVTGGSGSIDQYPANVGLPQSWAAKAYTANTAGASAWLKCIAQNWGTAALGGQATVSGFKVNEAVSDVPALTQDVQDRVQASKSSVLWFEALFGTKATKTSQANAAGLFSGSMTPQAFMSAVQTDLAAG